VNENYHGGALSEQEAAADASLLIASSLETTSQAITTLFRYVIANEAVFNRLRDEIDSVIAQDLDEINPSSLAELTYLDACVHEALRIVPPAPSGKFHMLYPFRGAIISLSSRTAPHDRPKWQSNC